MRRAWYGISPWPKTERCIFCQNVSPKPFIRPFHSSFPRSDLAVLLTPRKQVDTPLSAEPEPLYPRSSTSSFYNALDRQLRVSTDKRTALSSPIPPQTKAALLSQFHHAMATQDLDHIWPLYNIIYENGYIHHLSRRTLRHLFHYAVRSRATLNNFRRLQALMDDMKTRGIELRPPEYHAILNWVGGRAVPEMRPYHLNDALKLFEDMRASGTPATVDAYNILIYIASQRNDIPTAQRLYHDMVAQNIRPDAHTYATLITTMGRVGDTNSLERMLDQVKTFEHVASNVVVWNAAMGGLAANGYSDRAMAIFNEMHEALRWQKLPGRRRSEEITEVTPTEEESSKEKPEQHQEQQEPQFPAPAADVVSFQIHMGCLLDLNRIDDATELLLNLNLYGVRPTVTMYNALFAAVGQRYRRNKSIDDADLDCIRSLYKSMTDLAVPGNSDTMNTLINTLLDMGDTSFALQAFVELSKDDSATAKPGPHDVSRQAVAFLAPVRHALHRYKSLPGRPKPSQELLDRLSEVVG
ncbi:hypothetical protein BCR43DRAFT_498114 [Syncephalastrum racemosum]|uniref:Uncharacterized protein n=1 Tax=Syncephalastrum racemosum TaxID=13706 RepID=A0A1X2H4I3_SYNRA|nr:hypothetical protein BCR43DRAFT_498114 [Syncephalastrum racemosum]